MDLKEVSDNTNRHPWEIVRKRIVHKWIFDRRQKGNLEILDVGSGDAYLAESLTKAFSDCNAYCVDTAYTNEARNKIEQKFKNSNLNLYSSLNDFEVNNIDVVTLLDVIEHVPNDVEFLDQIISQPYIHNDTYFIITVPAYQAFFSKHDELLKHYRRYNLKLLKRTIHKCGLKSYDDGYFFSTLIIPRIFQLVLEKTIRKNKKPSNLGTWTGSKLTSYIIEKVLMIDYKMGKIFKHMGINLPGLSCYIICKRNNL